MAKDSDIQSALVGKMGVFLLMITVTILFGALSLGFFWAPSSGPFEIPALFYLNTGLLLLSSVLLHLGWERRHQQSGATLMKAALGIGLAFILGQVAAYWQLSETGLWINTSGRKMQFLYVLSGLHGLHLIGGLLFMLVVIRSQADRREKLGELALYFWHFLGILWLYLLIVLLLG